MVGSCSGSEVVSIALGGEVLSFAPANGGPEISLGEQYIPFYSGEAASYFFQVHYRSAPRLDLGCPVFDADGIWTLYDVSGTRVICFYGGSDRDLHQVVMLRPDVQQGDIYCVGNPWRRDHRPPLLGYRVGEVLFLALLAQQRGMLFHACGVSDDGRGLLFCGASGAGKSTLARLWQGHLGTRLLSDDRIVVRQEDSGFLAYGTPWHGDAEIASPETAPLERIFVIGHANENRVALLEPAHAALRLLECSFSAYWDSKGMAAALEFLEDLVRVVPCYELGFVPGRSVIELIRCANSR